MNILELRKVGKSFGGFCALNGVSFEVKRGEIFGVAGPNGSGKTTLFNVIAGLLPGAGEVIFEGTNIIGLRPYQVCHKGIARMFQIPLLCSTLTVAQNVRLGAHFGAQRADNEIENINEAIRLVGLEGKESIIGGNLNLFDKKLTMLAAACATKPKLLLLDEPIGGLSPMEISQFVTTIQKINNELGVTMIVIEHLMKVLLKISHRLMILDNGEKICIGSPDEVVEDRRVIEVYLGEKYA